VTASRWLVLALLAVALASGCGGDGGGDSTTEWADGVCSAITDWSESITTTAESLRGGNLSEDALSGAVDEFETATRDFIDELRSLGKPDTDAGEQAEESLDQLADDVDENISKLKSDVDEASGVQEAATAVTAALSTLGTQLASTFSELEQLDAAGELEDAFSEADSCDELERDAS
jgi:cell division protein ZapA (FtsZ GTPase activity inhibitor)